MGYVDSSSKSFQLTTTYGLNMNSDKQSYQSESSINLSERPRFSRDLRIGKNMPGVQSPSKNNLLLWGDCCRVKAEYGKNVAISSSARIWYADPSPPPSVLSRSFRIRGITGLALHLLCVSFNWCHTKRRSRVRRSIVSFCIIIIQSKLN